MLLPSVYIVVLNWNGWRDTIVCLNSLKCLNYSKYQVLVVDNGSTDESVDKILNAYPSIALIQSKKNLGFAGGCNIGIRHAIKHGAEYVWLLNNDTSVAPSALSEMVKVGESDKGIGAVGSVIYYMDMSDKVQTWGGGRISLLSGRGWDVQSVCNLDYLTGASMLLRGTSLRDVGYLDESFFMYWEDVDLSFRLKKAGWKLAVSEKCRIYHKGSGSVGKHSAKMISYLDISTLIFLKKHAPNPTVSIVVGMLGRILRRTLRREWNLSYSAISTLKNYLKTKY